MLTAWRHVNIGQESRRAARTVADQMILLRGLAFVAVAGVLAALFAGCSSPTAAQSSSASASRSDEPGSCNLANFLAVQHAHVNHAEVTLCGTVTRVRKPRRSRSGVHRNFFVDVGGGDVIVIDANVDIMGDFPIHPGERTTIRGEYYYDDDGREGIHWTHHTDRGPHPAGYVLLNGIRYD
jgi:hypothetical protein